MALVIPTNTASLDAQKTLTRNTASLNKSFARLSSGFRINTAADDAAGLAISESMKAQIRSYTIAERNANEAISMTQTAEAALGSMHDILGRMRELAIQSSNGSMTATDRGYLDTEFTALKEEMGRIQGSSKFNGKLLVSTAGESITFQVGLDNTASDQITLTFGGLSLTTLLAASTNVAGATSGSALGSIGRIDQAIGIISTERAKYGAAMNRLDVTTSSIQTMRVNLSAANSRIRDVDVAEETSQMARNQVLSQAGVSVLSQANQLPQMAMQLLQG
ncbi:MAG: flagellin FliC [Myxococcales bacterium]|nr:MAG: flagellin FliC [Myxococcales bacterium]